MSKGSTGDVLLLILVGGIVLYTTLAIDVGPVLVVFGSHHGVHVGDVVILTLALPVFVLLGKRLVGGTK